jgi:hypothetical protein
MICKTCKHFAAHELNQDGAHFLIFGCKSRRIRFGLESDLTAKKPPEGCVKVPTKCNLFAKYD